MPTSLLLEYCRDTIMPNKYSEIGFWSPVRCPAKCPVFFSDCAGIAVVSTLLGGTMGYWIRKCSKICFFLPFTGNRINWSWQSLACKCRLRLCTSVPNLAVIGSRGGYRSLPCNSHWSLVSTMYLTAAVWNWAYWVLTIQLQVSSFMPNFTFCDI